MADENTNLNDEEQSTGVVNTKSIVNNGTIQVYINDELKTIPIEAGMVGCFSNSTYKINDTGILKDKSYNSATNAPKWSCKIGGKEYIFDNNGHCTDDIDGDETHHLYIVASSINVAEGNKVTGMTRAVTEEEKVVSVDSLTVRDNFAIAALQALICKHENPIECSTATCKYISDKAYEFANAMMLSSSEARAQYEEGEGGDSETEGTVDVPTADLANNTEKLLNNIYKVLEAQKTQDQTQFEAGVKISNIDKVKFDGTPTVEIGNSPNVYVANTTANPVNIKEVSSSNS